MAHTIQEKKKLLNRVCKIMGQIAEAKEVATLPPPQASDITRYQDHHVGRNSQGRLRDKPGVD